MTGEQDHRAAHADALRAMVEAIDAFDDLSLAARVADHERAHGVEDTIAHAVMPCLSHIGQRWETGTMSVAQEHLASATLLRWLSGHLVADGGDRGRVILACPPGERHDLPLLACAVALGRLGWRVWFLGPNVPLSEVTAMADSVSPDAIVLSATRSMTFRAGSASLRRLARRYVVALGGAGASPDVVAGCDAVHLLGDPVAGARQLDGRIASLV